MTEPISVVIPTRDRPSLVVRAVRSALHQTLPPAEVVVVQDGEDPQTVEALKQIADARLRVRSVTCGGGPGAVRNAGVAIANGEWIAFLDDDDEMVPDRLALQLRAAQASKAAYPIILCRSIVKSRAGSRLLPDNMPEPGEHISEYLFMKKNLFARSGGVHMFCRRALMEAVPFPPLPRHEDWAWLLKATTLPESDWKVLADPLVIYHADEGRPSLSRVIDWEYSFDWVRGHRRLMSDGAYMAFLMSTVARLARQQAAYAAIPKIISEVFAAGRPRPLDYAIFIAIWSMPKGLYGPSGCAQFFQRRKRNTGALGSEP